MERRVREKLEQFWEQGISGADFFVSAIGPAVEVFGRYFRVEKLSGEEVEGFKVISLEETVEFCRRNIYSYEPALEMLDEMYGLGLGAQSWRQVQGSQDKSLVVSYGRALRREGERNPQGYKKLH